MSTRLLKCGFCSNPVPLPENPQVPSVMCPKCYHSIPLQLVANAFRAPEKGSLPPPNKPNSLPFPSGVVAKPLARASLAATTIPRCKICQCVLTGVNLSGDTCPACTKTVSFVGNTPVIAPRPKPAFPPVPSPAKAAPIPATTTAEAGSLPTVTVDVLNRFWMANRGRITVAGLALSILASLAFGVAVVSAPQRRSPAPLDFVRTDADLLLHGRVADVWNSKLIQEFYRHLPEHVRRQSEETVSRVGIGMEFVDTVTVTFTNPEQPSLCAVVKTNKKYGSDDRKKILLSTASAASIQWDTRTHRGMTYDVGKGHVPGTPDTPLAIYSASETLFVMGTELGVKAALDKYLDDADVQPSASTKSVHDTRNPVTKLAFVRDWIRNPEFFFVAAGALTDNVNQMLAALDDPKTSDELRQQVTGGAGVGGTLMKLRSTQDLPEEMKTLLTADAAMIALKLDANDVLHIHGQTHYPSDKDAKKCGDLLRGLLSVIQLVPEGSAALPEGHPQAKLFQKLSGFLRGVQVDAEDQFVSFSATQSLVSMVLDMQTAAEWAGQWHNHELTSAPNLKQLANAMELYYAAYGHYPPAVVMDDSGTRPLYSWRLAILPYLGPEAEQLYKEFDRNEPWDSPHNLRLSQKMPAVFEHPLARMSNQRTATVDGVVHGITPYQFPVGVGAAFFGNRTISKRDIVDGLDQTIMIMEHNPVVPWTSPQDVSVAAGDRSQEVLRLPSLVPGAPIEAVLFDQTSRQIDRTLSPNVFWGMINPQDGRGFPAAIR